MPNLDNQAKTFNVMQLNIHQDANSTLRDLCWDVPNSEKQALGKFVSGAAYLAQFLNS